MNIAGRTIETAAAPYIIAEIGVNHDGNLNRALELTEAAVSAGADAVKVQFFKAELLLSTTATLATYQQSAGETNPHHMLQRLELDINALEQITNRAHQLNIHAICTVFTPQLVELAETTSFDAYKAASPDLINRLLIERIAETNRPLILSTGTATLDEITRTLSWIPAATHNLVLMHCVSAYPTPDSQATLAAIRTVHTHFNLPTGYSDHTDATDTGALAVCAGACILEKHLTHSRTAPGPDHAASLEPDQFAEYVTLARRAHTMLGNATKEPRAIENDIRSLSRQSLAINTPIKAGETISTAHLTTTRPAGGIPASNPAIAIGRRAAHDLALGHLLRESDLA